MLYATQQYLEKMRKIARNEAKKLEKFDNVVSIFVYGSVARGDITNSSDIDMTIILNSHEKSYQVVTCDGITISEEFHPKKDYTDVEKLSARIYDAWIIYDPTNFLRKKKLELMKIYFTPKMKIKRIIPKLQLAENSLKKAKIALSKRDFESLPLHLRDFSENIGHVILDIANKTPSMRRFLYNMKSIASNLENLLLYDYMVRILGFDKYNERWFDFAIKGVRDMQKLFYAYPLDDQNKKEREIMSSLISEEYIKGTEELVENGEYESALFPCLLWESMVLFRRNPVMVSFFKSRGENHEIELNNAMLIPSLKERGFMKEFFDYHSEIVGSKLFSNKEYQERVKLADAYLVIINEMVRKIVIV